jgi:pyruvate-formate lyase-activating enzyme
MDFAHLPRSPDYAPHERLRVSLEFTNLCNFSCPFCPQAWRDGPTPAGAPYDRERGMLAPAVFERAVDECQRVADTLEIGFFGEQTLHARYVEYLLALRERRFALDLNTNLSFLTREMMDAWVEARVDLVRLSLDALSSDVFDRARPGKVRALDGELVGAGERMAAVNAKVEAWLARPDHRPTRLVFVKSSLNQGDELARFVEHWTPKLGPADSVLAKQVLSYGGKTADPLVRAHRCNVWDLRFLMIDWRGVVSPCNLDTNMDLALGSVMVDSLDALYRGPRAQDLRRRTGCLRELTPCRTCSDGNNWSLNETFLHPEHASARPRTPAARSLR